MRKLFTMALCMVSTLSFANHLSLAEMIAKYRKSFAMVLPEKYQKGKVYVMNISKNSEDFKEVDIQSTEALIHYGDKLKASTHADMLVGRYLENRNIYQRGKHYDNGVEARSVHLGQDLMVPAGTAIYAPLEGKVHSFADNNYVADYGPTIILEHELKGVHFYTLYGHLSRGSLKNLKVGQLIQRHQQIATVGKPFENGGWPSHLHFQIIDDMQGKRGNFIGVIQPSKQAEYALHCPNPNLILNIPALNA